MVVSRWHWVVILDRDYSTKVTGAKAAPINALLATDSCLLDGQSDRSTDGMGTEWLDLEPSNGTSNQG